LVEELVGKCGSVKEVAVKGEENEKGFDDIFIFISTDAKDEVEKYCENNLPEIWSPNLHFRESALPKLPGGKYDKNTMMLKIKQ